MWKWCWSTCWFVNLTEYQSWYCWHTFFSVEKNFILNTFSCDKMFRTKICFIFFFLLNERQNNNGTVCVYMLPFVFCNCVILSIRNFIRWIDGIFDFLCVDTSFFSNNWKINYESSYTLPHLIMQIQRSKYFGSQFLDV